MSSHKYVVTSIIVFASCGIIVQSDASPVAEVPARVENLFGTVHTYTKSNRKEDK